MRAAHIRHRVAILTGWAILLLTAFTAQAQPPPGYYDSAEGLTGQPLRAALHTIIANQSPLSYSGLWTAFSTTDAKPGNKVWDMYSDNPAGTAPYEFTLGTDQCGNYSSEGDCYNREHSFPQSWFNSGNPMRTDLFHIYPTDGWVNQKRGNLPFGRVGSADWTSLNGSKVGMSITAGYNSTVFEPIDAYKGDFARTYFYMVTRYLGDMANWESPMIAAGDLSPWAVALLLEWNQQDPVSPKETARNNAVQALQGNRNPFIDRPEWVQAIWGTGTGISAAKEPAVRIRVADGHLLVDMGPLEGLLRIRDLSGRIVLEGQLAQGPAEITFQAPSGVYLAEVRTSEGRSVQRFFW